MVLLLFLPGLRLRAPLSATGPGVEAERPLSVQCAQRPELQGHGVRTGAGRVLVLQGVVVVVLDWFPQRVQWEGPEPVEVDLLAEARGQRVHEQTSGGPLDVHFVGQPIPVHKDTHYCRDGKSVKACRA